MDHVQTSTTHETEGGRECILNLSVIWKDSEAKRRTFSLEGRPADQANWISDELRVRACCSYESAPVRSRRSTCSRVRHRRRALSNCLSSIRFPITHIPFILLERLAWYHGSASFIMRTNHKWLCCINHLTMRSFRYELYYWAQPLAIHILQIWNDC